MEYERLPFTDDERDQYVELLRREAMNVSPETVPAVIDDDPDDDVFLACALAGDAAFIVSGDDHLLSLGNYRNIEIVTPAGFLGRTQ
jgi:predicted nucleic acid-binding protein